MEKNLRRAAGSLLVVGLGGTELTGLERAWLRLVRPAGVVLFRRNISDPEQTRALIDEATGLSALHSARFVDVEGGTVNRFRDALAPMPSAQAVARADAKLGKKRRSLAREHGELIARAVKAFGFNTTLAPVVDLALPVSTEVMGTRAPAAGPADVVAFTREFLAGLASEGVAGCGKHFPGLGSAAGDTHFVTPEIGRTFKEIWSQDLVPYRELHKLMPMIMTNHAAYPKTKSANVPASATRFWIETVLRKQIGYRGLILTDDLEMGGILKFMPIEEAAVAAVRVGSDLLEICHSVELILRTFEALIAEAEKSTAFHKLLLQRATEVERKRAKLFKGVPKGLTAKQFDALRERVNLFREKVTKLSESDSVTPRLTSPAEHV
ncbi:beta-N-acetylhexosaminidase [Occallatibacter riparius]|uniref:beta-N-acetylhexosaminidase n=1 Tax=Occallatibacter riparius TaxID=1002689 RepID=A0A9J7BIV2_9BACT|nr:beta-N-acetylhexosaminidase [Occallatibacter riparius]UWZ82417.1 beta-N-acetylhexosaminidase [Occallatibacter riparius]